MAKLPSHVSIVVMHDATAYKDNVIFNVQWTTPDGESRSVSFKPQEADVEAFKRIVTDAVEVAEWNPHAWPPPLPARTAIA